MAPSKTTCHIYNEKDQGDELDLKNLAGSTTARNIIDLLLVIIILVLLSVAAPLIRGDYCGKFNILFYSLVMFHHPKLGTMTRNKTATATRKS